MPSQCVGLVHVQRVRAGQRIEGGDYVLHGDGLVVAVEPLQDDCLIGVPAEQLIGAGAVNVRVHPPLFAQDAHGGGVHHEAGWVGELGQEILLGRIDGNTNGTVVHHLEAGNLVGFSRHLRNRSHNVRKVEKRGVAVKLGVRCSLDGVFEVRGGDGLAVVEGDVVPKGEGVDRAGTRLPARTRPGWD